MEEIEGTFPVQTVLPIFQSEGFGDDDLGVEQSGKMKFLDSLLAHIQTLGVCLWPH